MGRRSVTYNVTPGKFSDSSILQDQDTFDIDKLIEHFSSPPFLLNLVEHLDLKKFNLQECCLNKWQLISKYDLKNGILTTQKSDEWFNAGSLELQVDKFNFTF